MVTLWHNVPTADAEMAPVTQFSKMLWKAIVHREDACRRGSSLADIGAWWEAARPSFQPLVDRALAARGTDGTIPHREAKALWNQVKGPISAAALTLASVGWKFTSAYTMVDSGGVEYPLTATAPALVRDLMRGALRDNLERKVAAAKAEDCAEFVGRRACLDLAISASRSGKRLSPQQSATFRAVACGAVWTAERARTRGYICDGLCALCKAAKDTIQHRVYECPQTRTAVQAAVPRWFWEEAVRLGTRSPFWTTALFPHPADVVPGPRNDLVAEVEYHGTRPEQPAHAAERMVVQGRTYVDGSCVPSVVRGLARAAFSIVVYGSRGVPEKTIRMPVPPHLPQTSQAAEYLAMATGFTYARGPAEVIGDCLNVVRAFASASRRALSPARKYAGLVLAAFRDCASTKTTTTRWTKAHRTPTGKETEEELADLKGNAAADEAAKQAVQLHPQIGAEAEADLAFYVKRAPHVVSAVVAAMQLFPPAPAKMERQPGPSDAREARRAARHHWCFAAGAWRCTVCNDYVTASEVPRYRRHQRCRGGGMADLAAAYAKEGHTLVRTDGQLPIVLCTRCGAWGNRRTRKLGQRCGAPTPAGAQAIKRVNGGWHPTLQLNADGSAKPRARVRITAAYDAHAGAWRPVVAAETETEAPHAPAAAAPPGIDPPETTAATLDHLPDADADFTLPHDDTDMFCDAMEEAEEEDVFGHGGGLDDTTVTNDIPAAPPAPQPCRSPPQDSQHAVTNPAAAATRRRPRDFEHQRPRDFTSEAVARLGAALRRSDADARGRLDRLRRRIRDKEQGEAEADSRPEKGDQPMSGEEDDRHCPERHADRHAAQRCMTGYKRREPESPRGERERIWRNGPWPRAASRPVVSPQQAAEQAPAPEHTAGLEGDAAGDRGPHLRRLVQGPHEGRGRKRPPEDPLPGPRASAPPQPHRCGGTHGPWEGEDKASERDSGCLRTSLFLSSNNDGVREGGPAGIGGALAPTPPAEADGGIASGGASAAADAAAAHRVRQPAASAAATAVAEPPTPYGQAPTLHDSPGHAPRTRAELLARLRGASHAGGSVGPRAAAAASGETSTPCAQPATVAGPTGDRRIRRGGATCPVAAMHAAYSACPRVGSAAGAAPAAAASDAGVRDGNAISASDRAHPVPSSATAGVGASASPSTASDADLAPARRRIVGKQRAVDAYPCEPSTDVASAHQRDRQGAPQLGRARTERPPG